MRCGGPIPRHARAAARVVVCALVACAAGACATTGGWRGRPGPAAVRGAPAPPPPRETPADVPRPPATAQTLESWDPGLSSAFRALIVHPSADTFYRVALEYRRVGVLDQAYSYLQNAIRLDPTYAPAYDARARIWRDWGFADEGLIDAYRAVYYAPRSAPAANTLGTLLQAVGRQGEARRWYGRAVALDGGALYALNNLCYVAVMQGDAGAEAVCERAQAAAPDSATARNNLALAYALRGDLTRARKTFDLGGDTAVADYNMGILYLAARAYQRAEGAFAAALAENPTFALAARRQRQARERSASTEEHGPR